MKRVMWLILLGFVVVAVPTRGQDLVGPPAAEEENLFGVPAEKQVPEPSPTLAEREFQNQVLARMQQPVDWDVEEETILDFADRLSAALDITVLVDWKSLEDLGLAEEDTVKGKFKQLPLEQALEYVLDQHDLVWIFDRRVLLILSGDEQRSRLDTRVYDVRDLAQATGIAAGPDFDTLTDLLISTIDADTWAENGGGEAEIRPLHAPGVTALVISQTQRTHRKIERLLAEIRLVRGTEPMPVAPTVAWGELASRLAPLAASLEETPAPEEEEGRIQLPMAGSREFAEAVTRANDFGFDLYRHVARQEGNQLVSGYGARELLTIALCGAKGQTRRELERVLHFPEGGRGHGLESFALRSSMARQGRGVELAVAGSLWVDQRRAIRPEFVTAADRLLQASTSSLDFTRPAEAARTINRWGSQATRGRIEEFVEERHIVPPGVLAGAVYFNGRWATLFDRKKTTEKVFRLASGEEVKVPTLHGFVEARAARFESGIIIGELYYGNREASMVILLPPDEPGALAELEETLTAKKFDEWLWPLRRGMVQVAMPKFKFDVGHELMPALAEMGLNVASHPEEADFSGITEGLALQQVWQRCVIEVDEQGTIAAAATGGGAFGGPGPTDLDELVVDRPFLFFIRDGQTGCVLFQGRVIDPRSE